MKRKPLPADAVVHASILSPQQAPTERDGMASIDANRPPPYAAKDPCSLHSIEHAVNNVPPIVNFKNPKDQFVGAHNLDTHANPISNKELYPRSSLPSNDEIDVDELMNLRLDHVHSANDLIFEDPETSLTPETSFRETQRTGSLTKPQHKASVMSNALAETSHFLGGLLKHPVESTKHYSILRHSHGLVYYKGPETSIAITVFSVNPLPSERKYWLQMKGWTGNTGMKLKVLVGTNSSWVDVTPVRQVQAADLSSSDERAWQRDIKKFLKKADKSRRNHSARETAILRIPSEATDGYFRVVLSKGDKKSVLCPSPVFRIASTSISASSLKGASLSTLPLELGLNIVQLAARQTASKVVAPYVAVAQQGLNQVIPQSVTSLAPTAYTVSGAEKFVNTVNNQYDSRQKMLAHESGLNVTQHSAVERSYVVGHDDGPSQPFPISLSSKIVRGSGRGLHDTGIPSANLGALPADTVLALHGVYFGWALITPIQKPPHDVHADWKHAVISIDYNVTDTGKVAGEKVVKAYLIHDYGNKDFVGCKADILVAGYLRPVISSQDEHSYCSETLRDIEITKTSLGRDGWTADRLLQRLDMKDSSMSLSDRGAAMRMTVQRTVDKIPAHRIGMRTASTKTYDRGMYGNGGIFVVRDVA